MVGLYHIPEEVVSEKFSYIKTKPLSVQFVPVAPCLLHAAPCGRKTSVFFVVIL